MNYTSHACQEALWIFTGITLPDCGSFFKLWCLKSGEDMEVIALFVCVTCANPTSLQSEVTLWLQGLQTTKFSGSNNSASFQYHKLYTWNTF